MKPSLVLGLSLSVAVIVAGCSIPSSSAAPPVQGPGPIVTPSVAPYPVEPPFPPVPPLEVQPTRRPPMTLVIPTPPTPLSRTARISRDQAISKALSNNPDTDFAGMQARGEITITATLTTWGDYSKRGAGPPTHPDLPVWVVKVERPPWSEWRGPVGKQIRVTWYGWSYVIDGLTGNMIDGSRISEGGR